MHNWYYTKSCLDTMVYMPHTRNLSQKLWNCLFTAFPSSILSLSVFSHQCDKWEFIPAGDEIFLPSLSLHPSFTASQFLFLLCILTSPSSPVLHRAPSGVLSTFLCWFVSLFLRPLRPESSPQRNLLVHLTCSWCRCKYAEPSALMVAPHSVFLLSFDVWLQ